MTMVTTKTMWCFQQGMTTWWQLLGLLAWCPIFKWSFYKLIWRSGTPRFICECSRDNFVYVPSQWERTLHCNVVSHWLGAGTEESLVLRIFKRLETTLHDTIIAALAMVAGWHTLLNFGQYAKTDQAPVPLMIFRSNSIKIGSALVSNILNWSQRNFVQATTVILSWRVQNFVVIGREYFKSKHCKIWSNFEFDRNIVSGTGACIELE